MQEEPVSQEKGRSQCWSLITPQSTHPQALSPSVKEGLQTWGSPGSEPSPASASPCPLSKLQELVPPSPYGHGGGRVPCTGQAILSIRTPVREEWTRPCIVFRGRCSEAVKGVFLKTVYHFPLREGRLAPENEEFEAGEVMEGEGGPWRAAEGPLLGDAEGPV